MGSQTLSIPLIREERHAAIGVKHVDKQKRKKPVTTRMIEQHTEAGTKNI
jgi:hypothetical protein